jgi:membrane protein implicated in regulation of membrane protease activity
MRKHALVLGLTFLALAAFSVFAGWTFFSGAGVGGGWRSLGPLWPYALGGAALVAALAAVLLWIAFHSARHGAKDRIDPEGH